MYYSHLADQQENSTKTLTNNRVKKLTVAINTALLASSLAVTSTTLAQAQENNAAPQALKENTKNTADQLKQTVLVNIAASTLSQVLSQFSGTIGVALSFDANVLAGKKSAGITGKYSNQQKSAELGFNKLLTGSGFHISYLGNNNYKLVADNIIGTLATTKIDDSSNNLASEGTGLYTKELVGIGKGNMSLREIPQSITVITHQRIIDQNLVNLPEIVNQTTGLSMTQDSRGGMADFYSRGFEINSLQIDGAATGGGYNGYAFSPNSSMYDSIEVIRGVDGLFSGSGGPGGTINLVRKKPLAESQVKLTTAVGSWNDYRGEVDATGTLSPEGAIRGRVVVSYQDKEFFYDGGANENKFIYGIVEADLGEGTLLSFGGSYEESYRKSNYSGVPRYIGGQHIKLPRSTSFIPDFAGGDGTSKEIFALLKHDINDNWQINASATYIDNELYEISSGIGNSVYRLGNTDTDIFAWGYEYIGERTFLDLNLIGNFEFFGQNHSVLVGIDKQKSKSGHNYHTVDFDRELSDITVDIFNFNANIFPNVTGTHISYQYQPTTISQNGIYGRINFELTDQLMLIVGGRYSNLDYDSISRGINDDGSIDWQDHTVYEEDAVFTPYIGVVYQLSNDWSLYSSFTEIHQSQADKLQGPLPGTPLDPIAGKNYELGLKADLWQGKVNAMLALYHIERVGEAVEDPAYPSTPDDLGQICCNVAQGEIVSEGFEMEVNGQLAQGWQLSAGYTYNQNENKYNIDENKPQSGIAYSSVTPKHLLKVWTSYQLPEQWHKWIVGGGVTAQSNIYNNDSAWFNDNGDWQDVDMHSEQAGYAVWSAMVSYDINETWSTSFNVSNLFDKTYFSDVGSGIRDAWYGEPRSLTLTLRGHF
jgi:outer membrane receptor for ferric coprogen and ferric-rhodotorulic acid